MDALKIIWDNLIVVLLILWAIICIVKDIDFKSKLNFYENYENYDNSQSSLDNDYYSYSKNNTPDHVSSCKTNSKYNGRDYSLFSIDEIFNTDCNTNDDNYEINNNYKIKKSRSSASKLNEYLEIDKVDFYKNSNKLDSESEESLLESQSDYLNKLSICKMCKQKICKYYSKAYYRFSDNSICEQCFNNIKRKISHTR